MAEWRRGWLPGLWFFLGGHGMESPNVESCENGSFRSDLRRNLVFFKRKVLPEYLTFCVARAVLPTSGCLFNGRSQPRILATQRCTDGNRGPLRLLWSMPAWSSSWCGELCEESTGAHLTLLLDYECHRGLEVLSQHPVSRVSHSSPLSPLLYSSDRAPPVVRSAGETGLQQGCE